MNHTPNYNLSQWEKSDRVLMEDFNADNAKIDAAIKAEAGARAALAAQLGTKGNCQIWTTSYIGSGRMNQENSVRISFPGMPLAAFVVGSDGNLLVIPTASGAGTFMNGGSSVIFSWNGTTVSWYGSYIDAHMNVQGVRYTVFGLYLKS